MPVKKVIVLLTVLLMSSLFSIVKAQEGCGTPANLQVSVSGNVVTFSWTGTEGADIHAILLRNEQTGENSKGYSSVGSDFATMTVPPGTYAWRVTSLCNTAQRITEDASAWIWGTPFTMGKVNAYIPQAHAGCEQIDVPGTSTGLSAMSPLDGTGQWTVISGSGGSFGNASSAISTFTGVTGATYILRWTVSNENGSTFSDVMVRFCTPPLQADAGADQLNVSGTSTVLEALAPQTGSGVWSIVSGAGGGFSDAFNPASAFITNAKSIFVLRWTVHNVCGSTSDDMTVSFCSSPIANAGADQLEVIGASTTLTANTPTEGTGIWSIVSGTGGSFGNISSVSTTFSGSAGTTYVLRWTVSNSCGSISDDVTIGFCTPTSLANAGSDQLDVIGTSTTLTATAPTVGTGIWSIVSGSGGSFGNTSSATSTFSGLAGTTYILRWTVSNNCNSNSDVVTIGFCTPASLANAGSDQLEITGISTTLTATSPTIGTGIWSVVSGTGGSFGNAFSATSTFTGVMGTTYVLRWTVSNSCTSNFDHVTVSFCSPPTQAFAGTDQLNVFGITTTLAATAPTEGMGLWTIESGTDGGFGNASSATSTFSGFAGITYVLRWTVSKACGSISDEVTIKFEAVTDIDGNNYPIVKIGNQTWMAQNLKTTRYNDGVTIPNVLSKNDWNGLTTGAWSNYDNNTQYDAIYGKLYNWYAVNTGKLCPTGWHIPTELEWQELTNYIGGSGAALRSVNEFNAMPAGNRYNGDFSNLGTAGYWWKATEEGNNNAMFITLRYADNAVFNSVNTKKIGNSCRCIKD